MKAKIFSSVIFWEMALLLSFSSHALALPSLQLDIIPGVYVGGGDDTTYATADAFDLYAYMQESAHGKTTSLTDTYYLSIAVSPRQAEGDISSIGSFSVDGTSYSFSDLVYGTPPVDSADLAPHGIFATYFMEMSFTFTAADTVAAYNVQDDSSSPGTMYYKMFDIDTTGLLPGYALHFDLYNTVYNERKDTWEVNAFAPFSHDAQSDPGTAVPEPATMLLFGAGLIGLAGVARRKAQ